MGFDDASRRATGSTGSTPPLSAEDGTGSFERSREEDRVEATHTLLVPPFIGFLDTLGSTCGRGEPIHPIQRSFY